MSPFAPSVSDLRRSDMSGVGLPARKFALADFSEVADAN
jgi:hypothetical protein